MTYRRLKHHALISRQHEPAPVPRPFGRNRVLLHLFSGCRRRVDVQFFLDALTSRQEVFVLHVISIDIIIDAVLPKALPRTFRPARKEAQGLSEILTTSGDSTALHSERFTNFSLETLFWALRSWLSSSFLCKGAADPLSTRQNLWTFHPRLRYGTFLWSRCSWRFLR